MGHVSTHDAAQLFEAVMLGVGKADLACTQLLQAVVSLLIWGAAPTLAGNKLDRSQHAISVPRWPG